MRITCPSCAAAYAVPDEMLARRVVKCARCGTRWTPVSAPVPVSVSMPEPDAEPAFTARPVSLDAETPAEPPPVAAEPQWLHPHTEQVAAPAARSKWLLVAWVASFALIGALLAGAYARRDIIMAAWPPSQRLYSALGLR